MGNRRNKSNREVGPYVTAHKCPKHNQWKKKGVCELCRLELEEIQRKNEETGGSNKPPVIIKTI